MIWGQLLPATCTNPSVTTFDATQQLFPAAEPLLSDHNMQLLFLQIQSGYALYGTFKLPFSHFHPTTEAMSKLNGQQP
jgi:hypothetical protein